MPTTTKFLTSSNWKKSIIICMWYRNRWKGLKKKTKIEFIKIWMSLPVCSIEFQIALFRREQEILFIVNTCHTFRLFRSTRFCPSLWSHKLELFGEIYCFFSSYFYLFVLFCFFFDNIYRLLTDSKCEC